MLKPAHGSEDKQLICAPFSQLSGVLLTAGCRPEGLETLRPELSGQARPGQRGLTTNSF